ncbi:hypothetical protein N7466_002746 [Penicillium verhagenii]|uniref:uncharacterized protein n=1 Tax=Penicillium verhagenii TaxID=1562060 RepID=UPI002545A0D5|nr:uncharacterized protein N7466_002746 [Penicillium verhagenii]KAJ5939612.1 hypothetical protein N7466_002746 [Penicillium verhagenii]
MTIAGDTSQSVKPKKRVVTTARREQNRAAQRAWRQRQRLNYAAPAIHNASHESTLKPSSRASRVSLPLVDLTVAQRSGPENSIKPPTQAPASETGSEGSEYTGLGSSSISLDSTPLKASETLVSEQAKDPSTSFLETDLKLNTLQTNYTRTLLALLQNANCLGFDISNIMNCDRRSLSPFYSPITPTDNPQSLVANKFNPSIPIHLQPTMAQILVPHHAALDLIPLPLLRDRAIMLSFSMPEVFDLWDLKLDIYVQHGIELKVDGDTSPWDRKNWDMKPWFGRKWGLPVCE